MNTKVKGDKIKEGSIPLSALDGSISDAIPYIKYATEPIVINIKKGVVEYNLGTYIRYGSYFKFNGFVYPEGTSNFDTNLPGPTITGRFENREATYLILSYSPIADQTVLLYPNVNFNKIKKEFLPDDIGGADWNAQEGEAGYIENKPFEKIIFDGIIESDNTIVYDYNISASAIYISCENKEILRFINAGGNEEATLDQPNIKISWNGMDNVTITNLSDESIDAIKSYISIYAYKYDIRLPSSSIDDGVIKTFPQTLSDEDKNQALANLGIDPVVWKYLLNPYQIGIFYDGVENTENGWLIDSKILDSNLVKVLVNNPEIGRLLIVANNDTELYTVSKYMSDDRHYGFNINTLGVTLELIILEDGTIEEAGVLHHENNPQ